MTALWDAGQKDAVYHQIRLQYIYEFSNRFPEEDDELQIKFANGLGETLWEMGKRSEAEVIYRGIVERWPDEGWAYIYWAEQHWTRENAPKEYAQGTDILMRALRRPDLRDREDVLEYLASVYFEGGPQAIMHSMDAALAQLEKQASKSVDPLGSAPVLPQRKKNVKHSKCKKKKR